MDESDSDVAVADRFSVVLEAIDNDANSDSDTALDGVYGSTGSGGTVVTGTLEFDAENGVFLAEYVPFVAGTHLLNVTFQVTLYSRSCGCSVVCVGSYPDQIASPTNSRSFMMANQLSSPYTPKTSPPSSQRVLPTPPHVCSPPAGVAVQEALEFDAKPLLYIALFLVYCDIIPMCTILTFAPKKHTHTLMHTKTQQYLVSEK